MNKCLNYIKNSLLFINLIAIIYFIIQNGIGSTYFALYIIGFSIIFFITIKDIKNNIIPNERYNILFMIVEFIVLFLFFRTFFDQNFICNSSYYMNIIQSIDNAYSYLMYDMIQVYYFSQNVIYLLIMYFILYLYHKIEYSKNLYQPSKYSMISITLCMIHILTIPWIFLYFEQLLDISLFPIYFFLLEIILLIIEIISLIIYNHKKRDYPIYICFLFNLFAFIAIFT